MLAALLGEGDRDDFRTGVWMSMISLIVFAVLGNFFGLRILATFWPVLLIVFGVWILIQPLFKSNKSKE
jgi:hypothetical protein